MLINELCPDNFRDGKEVLMMQNPVNVFSALLTGLSISFELLGLLLFSLQFV